MATSDNSALRTAMDTLSNALEQTNRRNDPKHGLHQGVGEYLAIILDVLERAKSAKSKETREELEEIAQGMLANYDKINDATRVVLGLSPHGNSY